MVFVRQLVEGEIIDFNFNDQALRIASNSAWDSRNA